MAWYRAGTVSVTNNSSTVTGASTDFAANSRVGDAFIGPDGKMYEVTNVASATVISITPNYSGSTASGQSYSIVPVQGYTKSLADQAAQLVNDFGDKGTAYSRDVVTSNADTTPGRLLQVGAAGAQLGADVYRRANIVGTVSQSGGVPTGSVIQRGSNPNGEFTILADGTAFAWKSVAGLGPINSAAGAFFYSSVVNIGPLPISFLSVPSRAISIWGQTNSILSEQNRPTTSTGGSFYLLRDSSTANTNFGADCNYKGRFF